MSATDLLQQLQATFPAGQTSGTFDATRVQGGEYVQLLTGLGIPTTLGLASPTGWQTDGTVVTFSGTVQTTVLGVPGTAVWFQFTPSGGDWVLLMDVALPPSWTFATSFPMLSTGLLAELTLDAAHTSALVVASGAAADTQRQVGGAAIQVQAGLTFYGWFASGSSALTQVEWILESGQMQAAVGPVDWSAADGTVSMRVTMASATLGGLFGTGGPALDFAVSLYSGLNQALQQYEYGVRFDATLDFGSSGNVDVWALLAASQQPILDLTVSGTALSFPDPATLAQFFGENNGITAALPSKFQDTSLVQVNALTFGIGLQSQSLEYGFLSVGALTGQTWPIWPNVIELGNVNFVFSIFQPLGSDPTWSFDFSAVFTLGTVPILIQAQLPGEVLTGRLDPTVPPPSLVPLVQEVFGFTNGLPPELVIGKLDFSANIPQSIYSADLEIDGDWSFDFGTDNQITFEDLGLGFAYDPTDGAQGSVSAAFAIDTDNQFAVELEMTEGNTTFLGAWEDTGAPLTFQDIAIALGMYGLANLPRQIDLGLKSAHFQFDSGPPDFSFDIETSSYGGAAMVAGKNAAGTDWGFVYGMVVGLDLSLDLTNIPVVGQLVPTGDDVIELKDLRIVAATTALPAVTLTDAQKQILGDVVNSGLALSIDLQVGSTLSESFSVRFGGSDDGTASDTPPSGSGSGGGDGGGSGGSGSGGGADAVALARTADVSAPPTTAEQGPQATWVNVQRAFGPVQINRIGFALTADEKLGLLVDATVALDGLSVGLTGLEAEIPISSPFTPTFALAGLQVSFTAADFTIAGGLQHAPGTDTYTGDLEVSLGNFGATALGSYGTLSNGDASLFAFVFIDIPLGGPPFFFVTGLAGGFGYNRSLRLPTIDTVASYPLVQGAMGTLNASRTLKQLQSYIAPEENEEWFAAGVRFTSFEMVKSFALLTVAFGANVEIALMGESTMTVPVSTADNPQDPVAEADLVVLVDVAVTSGVIAVSAQLSPSSYVFSKSARLTGGFAFYVWFGASPYAGDFVVTLGGYNPYFVPQPYYPTVPRLGLNWQVSTELLIKGGLYFALTPSVIMAGGSLDATWQSGNIKAWFNAQTDFLIRFKPFTYEIDLSVSLGASVKLDLLVTTKTITVTVGVGLAIWGPSFGGTARVDLWIISFTLRFGSSGPPGGGDIQWPEFRDSFLPPAQGGATGQSVELLAAADDTGTTSTNALVTINAPTGIQSTFTGAGNDTVWSVSPGSLVLVIGTQVPSTSVSVSPTTPVTTATAWQTQLGVGPMGAAAGSLAVSLEVQIQRDDAVDDDDWTATAVLGSVPSGMWLNTANTMQTDGTVANVLTGVTLVPSPPGGQCTLPVPLQELLADDPPVCGYAWSDAPVPQGDTFDQDTAMEQMQSSLVDPNVGQARTAILAALTGQGLSTAQMVDVAAFAQAAPDLLFSPPTLRYLGEVPGAGTP